MGKWTAGSRHCGSAEMYYVVTLALLVTMGLALARAVLGPTVYDRVLSVIMFGTKTV